MPFRRIGAKQGVKSKVPVQPKPASDDMKMRTAKEVPFYDLTIAYLRETKEEHPSSN